MHHRRWWSWLRLQTSLLTLVAQMVLVVALMVAVTGFCRELVDLWLSGVFVDPAPDELLFEVVALGALPIGVGAWLTAGFGRGRRRNAWLVFWTVAVVLLSIDCLAEPVLQRFLESAGLSLAITDYRWDWFSARLLGVAAMMTVAAAGIPVGMLILAAHRRWRQYRWRARRQRFSDRRVIA
jgi:hypothetical protein